VPARPLHEPVSTLTTSGSQQQLVTAQLAQADEAGALRVAAFLMRYYGTGGQWGGLDQPASTITTRDRLALVTVHIQGQPWVIVDIGLRMLTPRELYLLQGFPPSYIIDRGIDEHGRWVVLSKKAQTHMCGNSVNPKHLRHLVQANHHTPHWMDAAA
jgi:DNA (cytosine-5)-methyltransferase 1